MLSLKGYYNMSVITVHNSTIAIDGLQLVNVKSLQSGIVYSTSVTPCNMV